MVSLWSGRCRAVILSLLFAEFPAVCLHRHRKRLDRVVYNMKYLSPTASDQIETSLVKTCPVIQ